MKILSRLRFTVPVAVLFALCVASAQAQILLDENFESYDNNVTLHNRNPGDGNPNNWEAGMSLADRGSRVFEGSSTGGSGANERIVRFYYEPVDSGLTYPHMRRLFADTETEVRTSFKIRIDDPDSIRHQVILQRRVGSSTSSPVRFRFSATGFTVLGRPNPPSTVDPGEIEEVIVDDVIIGDWYEVVVTADPVSQTFWASVRNLDNDQPGQSGISPPVYFWTDVNMVNRWSAEQASLGSLGASFDDIIVELVPDEVEPLQVNILPVTAEGYFRMSVLGEPERNFSIEASTDLTGWDDVVTGAVIDHTGEYEFTDTAASTLNRRFYRVRSE